MELSAPSQSSPNVITCYDVLDAARDAGIQDITQGICKDDIYEEAQQRQAEHLLDLARCNWEARLLEIGCSYGRILDSAERRGALPVGITVSSPQFDFCRRRGFAVRQLNYPDVPSSWNHHFDCAIANGSVEHFVQAEDAARGEADEIYREMFAAVHRLLDPSSRSGRFVTTTIHFDRVHIDPNDMVNPPSHFCRGSNEYHYSMLVHGFGGFYPSAGQLEACAAGSFDLIHQEDGTEEYYRSADAWLKALKQAFYRSPQFVLDVAGKLIRSPHQASTLLDCLLFSQSWNWQFRGKKPPMKLLRQVWQRV